MHVLEPITYRFKRPICGTVREDERTASWMIEEVSFNFLIGDQPPPADGLVFNCHHALQDDAGEQIPVEILALLDLEQGLRVAFKRHFGTAMEAVKAA